MLHLHWVKRSGGAWCPFKKVDFGVIAWQGVYVIWYEGKEKKVVKVGHGDICSRILDHRSDRSITQFAKQGPMYVTWAVVSEGEQAGVEGFLIRTLNPLVKSASLAAQPVVVDLPW